MIIAGAHHGSDWTVAKTPLPTLSLQAAGIIVAASEADVGDEESCIAAVIEAGVKVAQIPFLPDYWLRVRIIAVNIRAMRYLRRKSIGLHLQ